MGNLKEHFTSFVNSESTEFSLILEIMFHSKKEEGKRFLNLMNNIIDYKLSLPSIQNEINFHIIHLPACEPWSRELFLEFLIHKTALFHDNSTIKRFNEDKSKDIVCKSNKEFLDIKGRNRYYRDICTKFTDTNITDFVGTKNFIIHKESDLFLTKEDKNPYINSFYTDINRVNNKRYNLLVSTETDAFALEDKIREIPQPTPIESVFILHVRNNVSRSYCKNQLERLNQYNLGIKNCFIFSISGKPFVLNNTIESIKKKYISVYLQRVINKYNDFDNFITFTQKESNYLFNRNNKFHRVIIDSPDRLFFSNEIETFIENIEYNIKIRNRLSLCWSDKNQRQFSGLLSRKIPDFKHEMCNGYYTLLSQVWQKDIAPRIQSFIGGSNKIAFIVEKDTPSDLKNSIVNLFQVGNRNIRFYKFEDLKFSKNKGRYNTSVPAEKIIIMQYKSPNGALALYPNSFDELCLNNGQEALSIVNNLTHDSLFEWDYYWYCPKFNGVLYSNFRKEFLNWRELSFKRPQSSSPKDFIDEDDEDNNHRPYQTEKCRIHFKNGIKYKDFTLSEDVIYEVNDIRSIGEIKEILDLDNLSIQLLEDITEKVKILITAAINKNNNVEKIIRSDLKYNLSEDEKSSTIELWKILLKRKVDEFGAKKVYEDVLGAIPVNERISVNAFSQWYSLSSTTILPRSKKDQKSVLSYLGFEIGSAYQKIISTKKLANINGTKKMNMLIENLLKNFLFINIEEDEFEKFQYDYSDILTLINANSYNDLISLKELLLQEIDLKPVERFDYDKN
jgi:hypothetical protein